MMWNGSRRNPVAVISYTLLPSLLSAVTCCNFDFTILSLLLLILLSYSFKFVWWYFRLICILGFYFSLRRLSDLDLVVALFHWQTGEKCINILCPFQSSIYATVFVWMSCACNHFLVTFFLWRFILFLDGIKIIPVSHIHAWMSIAFLTTPRYLDPTPLNGTQTTQMTLTIRRRLNNPDSTKIKKALARYPSLMSPCHLSKDFDHHNFRSSASSFKAPLSSSLDN
jgi:hypothetical protein